MNFEEKTIVDILLKEGYITQEDFLKGEEYSKDHWGSFLDYFLLNGLISRDLIGQALAEYFNIPYFDLNSKQISKEQVLKIPEDVALDYRVILIEENANGVFVATDNPQKEGLEEAIKKIFENKKINFKYSLSEDLDSLFILYRSRLDTRFSKIIENGGKIAPEIIDQIIEDALLLKVSDIHLEPKNKNAIIRFRIDGVLHDAGEIPIEFFENIINRIKVQAKLRIDEHFNTQDGAIRYFPKNKSKPVDLRISIVPVLDGEKVAIRVLSSYVRDLTLNDIGLSLPLQEQIVKSSKKPFGMILVTGPTGSGKTTTLYSLIKQLNTRQVNITTIEDPAEYKIEGINQIQVNHQTNLTFAKGLKSISRQDPNIVLVGEIRDFETADIAVNAALTGHLLLSTFHANNAPTAIPRFIDMGIEPFLVSSTLELVISQRLVRKICDSCKMTCDSFSKEELGVNSEEYLKYFDNKVGAFYKGKGCDACSHTGFRGRIGVFEFLLITPELQDLISKKPSTKEILDLAKSQGFKTMFEDGVEKVKRGITTLPELLRIVSP